MKANFALTLSFTGIRLLHRAAGGWRRVGDVALDDPNLDRALSALRKTALALEPAGLRTKLVIPATQIKYLTIDTEGVPEDRLHGAAKAALQGETPYAVEELVFDLSPDGPKTHIAAVARETLAEAEAFAVEHRFVPISCVAIPDAEAFLGEPFFGATDHAADMLGPDSSVEPDGVAVVELDTQEWPEGPVVTVEDDAPVAVDDPRAAEPTGAAMDGEAEEPDLQPVQFDQKPSDAPEPRRNSETAGSLLPEQDPSDDDAAPTGVGFASRRRPDSRAAPKLGGVTRRFEPGQVQKPAKATPSPEQDPPSAQSEVSTTAAATMDDDVPNPPPAVLAAFLSARRAEATRQKDTAKAADVAAPTTDRAPTGPVEEAGPEEGSDAVDGPPTDFAATQERPEIRPVRVPQPKSERQRMTVFGARQPEADGAAVVGGKPRYLGLILTAMLLIFLAGVAAWAAVFAEDGLSRFFAPRQPEAPVTAEERAPEAEVDTTRDAQIVVPEEPAAPEEVQTAALDTDLPPETLTEVSPEVLAEPAPPPVFDPAEAEAQYAVTGIWTVPPNVPEAPGLVTLDDLYMTSIDPANLSFDAVALTPEDALRSDRAPLSPANPAPAGTEFDLDDKGLVVPTPDGAMSPDGILVHSGPPPSVPPATPERIEDAPEEVDAAARRELSGFRPKGRPDDLVESTERQRLGGLSRSELAAYRPELRPDTVKKAAEEDETPTAQAVASSLKPSNSSRKFRADRGARPTAEPQPQHQRGTDAGGGGNHRSPQRRAQHPVPQFGDPGGDRAQCDQPEPDQPDGRLWQPLEPPRADPSVQRPLQEGQGRRPDRWRPRVGHRRQRTELRQGKPEHRSEDAAHLTLRTGPDETLREGFSVRNEGALPPRAPPRYLKIQRRWDRISCGPPAAPRGRALSLPLGRRIRQRRFLRLRCFRTAP